MHQVRKLLADDARNTEYVDMEKELNEVVHTWFFFRFNLLLFCSVVSNTAELLEISQTILTYPCKDNLK